jgi:hypothetical protein
MRQEFPVMNRRAFLTMLAAVFVAPDPERLLWVPGEKKIFIPQVLGPHVWINLERTRSCGILDNGIDSVFVRYASLDDVCKLAYQHWWWSFPRGTAVNCWAESERTNA